MHATAEYLLNLRLSGSVVDELPAELLPRDLAHGYQIQTEMTAALCAARGGTYSGYKVALTSTTAQALVGYPAPVFGRMLEHSCHRGGVVLPADEFTTRIVETEFAFQLADDVPAGEYTQQSIMPFVGDMFPSIELVDHRFAGLDRMNAATLAADNAIHGGWVRGVNQANWRHIDLASHQVSLRVNGVETLAGAGNRVLEHPVAVLAWLANELPRHGLRLRAGDFVTTGLATDGIYSALAGDELVADFGALGQVLLDFS